MPNAVQMIRQDHKKVQGLFKKFDQAKKNAAKKGIADQVIQELEVHAKLEEEIFYPAIRKELGEEEMLDEAKKEHQQAKDIMRELKTMNGGEDDELEEKFSELVECIQHHVEEEEGEMLPKVEESEMDLADYGEQMSKRKKELTGGSQTRSKSKSKRKSKAASGRRRSRAA